MQPLALAESAKRVYCSIMYPGDGTIGKEAALPGYIAVADQAPGVFEAMQGMPMSQVADRLYVIWRAAFDLPAAKSAETSPNTQLAWEAVARHLAALLDDFDGEEMTLEDLEKSWGPWASSKLEKLQATAKG